MLRAVHVPPMKKTLAAFGFLALTVAPLSAQQMIEDWAVDHFKPFGLWESICDHRERGGSTQRRCYIRYVDGYAPHPKFGASFAFVTPEEGGLRFEFGFEPGTEFAADGFTLRRMDGSAWSHDTGKCEGGNNCIFEGEDAALLAAELSGAADLVFTFTDRHGRSWMREWAGAQFAAALADFTAASAERGLL